MKLINNCLIKRLFAIVLTVCMLLSSTPVTLGTAQEQTGDDSTTVDSSLCAECGEADGAHTENCSQYVAASEETTDATDATDTTDATDATQEQTELDSAAASSSVCTECGEADGAHTDTCPQNIATVEDTIPETSSPTLNVTFGDVTLDSTGNVVLTGWDYIDENGKNIEKSLKIVAEGLDPNATYELLITLDNALYFSAMPADDTNFNVGFTPNQLFHEDGTLKYSNANSGEATITFKTDTGKVMLEYGILYDLTLWNRQAGASLRWRSGPDYSILQVTLKKKDEETALTQKLKDCTAGIAHSSQESEAVFILPEVSGSDSLQYERFFVKDTGPTMVLRMWRGSGAFCVDDLVINITLPYCKFGDTIYSLDVDESSIVPGDGNKGIFDPAFSYSDGKRILTIRARDFMGNSGAPLCKLKLIFPEGLESAIGEKAYDFKWKVEYSIDNSVANTDNLNRVTANCEDKIIVYGDPHSQLVVHYEANGFVATNDQSNLYPMGSLTFRNEGGGDATNIVLKYEFDINNTNAVGVTSMNILSTTDKSTRETITVKYTMVDGNGKVITDEAGEVAVFTYDLANDWRHSRYAVLFHRGMLPAEQQNYYFKSVQYEVSEITANVKVEYPYSPLANNNPGSFWGYALREIAVDESIQHRVTVISATDVCVTDGQETPYTDDACTDLGRTLQTIIKKEKAVPLATNRAPSEYAFKDKEIIAGEATKMTFRVSVHNSYSASNHACTYLDNIRVLFKLPKGVTIDTDPANVRCTFTQSNKLLKCEEVEVRDDPNYNIYVLKFAAGQPIGYANEALGALYNESSITLTTTLYTDSQVIEERTTLKANEIVAIAGEGFSTSSTGGIKRTKSDADYQITGIDPEQNPTVAVLNYEDTLVIVPNGLALDVTESVVINTVAETATTIAIHSAGDSIIYQMNLKNNRTGTATDFQCSFAIPQALQNGNGDKIVMSDTASLEGAENTGLKIQYTTTPIENLANATWVDSVEKGQWGSVTMVRLVQDSKGKITPGANITFEIPMKYDLVNNEYSSNAGAYAILQATGNYQSSNSQLSSGFPLPTEERKLIVKYNAADDEAFALTAAKDRKPSKGNNKHTYTTVLKFHNPQTFTVANLKTCDVDLVDWSDEKLATLDSSDSNKYFKIIANMNDVDDAAGDVLAEGLNMGTLPGDVNASFQFTLYHGNNMSESTTERYITFDLVSEYVTIPVRIDILRELTAVSATQSAITKGKVYQQFPEPEKPTVITNNSAFTAQFVCEKVNPNNSGRILKLNSAFPKGTTIVLLDYTIDSKPRYARYVSTGDEKEIDLTAFKLMGTDEAYAINNVDVEFVAEFDEKLLFVVDFSGADGAGGNNVLQLVIKGKTIQVEGNEGKEDVVINDVTTGGLTVTAVDPRQFGLGPSTVTTTEGASFELTYTVSSIGDDIGDSKYDSRNLAIVIEKHKSVPPIPADAKLYVNNKECVRNSEGQFIIPLTDAQAAVKCNVTLRLESVSMRENNLSTVLNASLWAGATTQAESPLKGAQVAGPVSVEITTSKGPSLKVTSMSNRVLTYGAIDPMVTVAYQTLNVPEGGRITLEIQKQQDSGAYITGWGYLGTTNNELSKFTVPTDPTGPIELQFNSGLAIGNYQLLFKVLDSDGKTVLLTVPYRFIIVKA